MSPLRLIRVPLLFRSPRTLRRLVNLAGRGRSIARIFRLCLCCRATTCHDGSRSLSPRQTQGLLTLTPEDIKARINRNRSVSPSSLEKPRDESQMDEVMPALNSKFYLSSLFFSFLFLLLVMRTGTDVSSTGDNDFLPFLHPSSTNALPSQTYRLFFLCRPNQPHHVP